MLKGRLCLYCKANNGVARVEKCGQNPDKQTPIGNGLSVGTSIDRKFDYFDSDVCRVFQSQDLPPTWYSHIGLGVDDKKHSVMQSDPCKIVSLDLQEMLVETGWKPELEVCVIVKTGTCRGQQLCKRGRYVASW